MRIVVDGHQVRHVAGGPEPHRVPGRVAVRKRGVVGHLSQVSIRIARKHGAEPSNPGSRAGGGDQRRSPTGTGRRPRNAEWIDDAG
ncbi:hypothetical protein GCM10010169_07970 [Micromonospora fulviviridis]|nr:hypothetical protein GCM10010169_07970 [Micromonospora fulviviridis]